MGGMAHQVFMDKDTKLSVGMTRDQNVCLNHASGTHPSPTKFLSNFDSKELKTSYDQRCFIEKKYLHTFYDNTKLRDFEEYRGFCIKSNAVLFLSTTNEIVFQNENECYLKVFETPKNYFNVYRDRGNSIFELLDSNSDKNYKTKHFEEIAE